MNQTINLAGLTPNQIQQIHTLIATFRATNQKSPPFTHSLARFYGICADAPIMIDDQGISEALDDNLEELFDYNNAGILVDLEQSLQDVQARNLSPIEELWT